MTSGKGKSNFIILYHRSPYEEVINSNGEKRWKEHKSPNGIIPTLRNLFLNHPNGTWIAWRQVEDASNNVDERITLNISSQFLLRRIPLEPNEISSFYHVTSKESFWPILHTFPTYFDVNNADWSIFEDVNKRFANAACREANEGAIVWVHDYNLWLAPSYIKEKRPDIKIAFFHHTPFPGNDVFAILPWRRQII